jgi:hypothetical protein
MQMAATCVINLEDIRSFARRQSQRLPERSHREWLERALLRHVVTTGDGIRPGVPSRGEIAAAHVARAIAAGEATVRFSPPASLAEDVALVVDWLAGLRERDPRLAGKVRRIVFGDALGMSRRWHRQMRYAAERKQAGARTIPADPVGAPVVLDAPSSGTGWSWVWLKTPEARKAEGEAMGHCVGSGGYESLDPEEAILSLRDPDGVPHVTLHLAEVQILRAVAKGNADVPVRYQAAVERAAAIIGVRLLANDDPGCAVPDGRHWRKGNLIHVRLGLLHRDSGPAVVRENGTREWFCDGKRHREDGPVVEGAGGTMWWY